jgi:diguanylate cyclase (GGDEF)-like protein/PAS domain S-box-containing protein
MHKNSTFLALYEISMSIGNSLDLDRMLKEAVTVMLSRLNCSSAAIYQKKEDGYRLFYAKPKVVIKNETYRGMSLHLEARFAREGRRMLMEEYKDRYYYLFELKNFGYLILTKSCTPFDEFLLNSMPKINLKLVNAIRACKDNRKLQESRESLAEAQRIAHLGSWSMTLSPLRIMWDEEVFRILGTEPGSFVPAGVKKVLQYLPKRQYSSDRKQLIDLLRGNNVDFEGVFEFRSETVEKGYVQIKSRPVYDSKGTLVRVVGTMLDITKQHQLEQRIRQESTLIKSIINTVPVRIFWKDTQLRFMGCNKLFAEDAGFKNEQEIIGKTDLNMIWKDLADHYRAKDLEVMTSGKPRMHQEEIQFQHNGRKAWVSKSKLPLIGGDGTTYGVLGAYLDITRIKESESKLKSHRDALQFQANHDVLTNLPNRMLFQDRLELAINNARRTGKKVAVLFIDLDKFKQINDTLGHAVGDEVIREVASRLSRHVRDSDTLARFGGDEFVMLFNNIDDPAAVESMTRKMIESMAEPAHINDNLLKMTLSIGISIYPNDADSLESLLKNADVAMYQAKRDGRDTYQFYSNEDVEGKRQLRVEKSEQLLNLK